MLKPLRSVSGKEPLNVIVAAFQFIVHPVQNVSKKTAPVIGVAASVESQEASSIVQQLAGGPLKGFSEPLAAHVNGKLNAACYSCRSATIGSMPEARRAGR
jgi:hypothetical protein